MQALINGKILCNSISVARIVIFPSRFQLAQRNAIWSVAVHLVRAHKYEHGFWRMPPASLQQIQRPHRIDVKVLKRHLGRQIVTRLCRSVNDKSKVCVAKQYVYGLSIANVQRQMTIVLAAGFEPLTIPSRVPFFAEEYSAHVVVDSGYGK
jgi:hypothetical protein